MTRKEYNSPEYYAQEFRDFLRHEGQYGKRRYGGIWPAEQHFNRVIFSIYKDKYCITFNKIKSKLFAQLDELVNGAYQHSKNIQLNPKHSKTGRLSKDYVPRILLKELFHTKSTNSE